MFDPHTMMTLRGHLPPVPAKRLTAGSRDRPRTDA